MGTGQMSFPTWYLRPGQGDQVSLQHSHHPSGSRVINSVLGLQLQPGSFLGQISEGEGFIFKD